MTQSFSTAESAVHSAAEQFPEPLPCKAGWPWTGQYPGVSEFTSNGAHWPRISIVTPSFNQGHYIEETIRSVLLQGYPNLEYIVIDGGSTDDTLEILHKYDPWITYWVSEADRGQTHAINKGMERATGEILAYINSDDLYMPYTFRLVAELFTLWPDLHWLTGHRSHIVDERVVSPLQRGRFVFNQKLYQQGFHTAWFFGWNQQVSTFWRRSLFEKAGGRLDESFDCSMDIDLWVKMAHHAPLTSITAVLAAMRQHANQKSRTLRLDYQEIEGHAKAYRFLPISTRKFLFLSAHVPGLRAVLRQFWCDGKGPVIRWNIQKECWEMVNKYVF